MINRVRSSADGRVRERAPNAVVVATVGSGVGPVPAELSGVRLDGVCWIRPSVDAGAVAVGKDIWAQLDDEPDARRLSATARSPCWYPSRTGRRSASP